MKILLATLILAAGGQHDGPKTQAHNLTVKVADALCASDTECRAYYVQRASRCVGLNGGIRCRFTLIMGSNRRPYDGTLIRYSDKLYTVAPPAPRPRLSPREARLRLVMHRCEKGDVKACIERGARRWRVDIATMMRRARCESRLDPGAKNGKYKGLFQFGDLLWSLTPYAQYSPYSAKWSSLAAAWGQAHGYASHWSCR